MRNIPSSDLTIRKQPIFNSLRRLMKLILAYTEQDMRSLTQISGNVSRKFSDYRFYTRLYSRSLKRRKVKALKPLKLSNKIFVNSFTQNLLYILQKQKTMNHSVRVPRYEPRRPRRAKTKRRRPYIYTPGRINRRTFPRAFRRRPCYSKIPLFKIPKFQKVKVPFRRQYALYPYFQLR